MAEGGVPVMKRWDRWAAGSRKVFLDQLAATGHITGAARAAGRTSQAAHALRRRDAGFAAEWQAAMAAACDALHAKLIERAMGDPDASALGGDDAGATGAPCPACGAGAGRPFDADLALQLLRHRASLERKPANAPLGSIRYVPIEKVEASLNRKIDAIIKARRKK